MGGERGEARALQEEHGRHLWWLCYRMTGSAADADDLVQETFLRALTSPPAEPGPWRPWLTRVAMNLGRDLLRARRRQGYAGPWLPSPVATTDDEGCPLPGVEPASTEGRYELLESVSYAFLVALERLSATQRAVLILREVLGHSVDETAKLLGLSEANVKTSLHRARAAMAPYDEDRCLPSPALRQRNQAALLGFLQALAADDGEAMVALLRQDVRAITDGGGVYAAARLPVLGAAKLTLFLRKTARLRGPPVAIALRLLNGMPAVVADYHPRRPGDAPRAVVFCRLDASGLIASVDTVVAPRKLSAVG